MYVCTVCSAHVGPRKPLLKHIIYNGKAIHRELPVCEECKGALDAGVPLDIMLKQHGKPLSPGKHMSVAAPVERPGSLGKPVIVGKSITRARPRPNGVGSK
jgi:hypothetical protein